MSCFVSVVGSSCIQLFVTKTHLVLDPKFFIKLNSSKMTVFWVVAPRSLVEVYDHGPDDWSSKDLRNCGKLLPDYTELQPKRQSSSYSPPWESKILHKLNSCSQRHILSNADINKTCFVTDGTSNYFSSYRVTMLRKIYAGRNISAASSWETPF
jgi:hypothetical protein